MLKLHRRSTYLGRSRNDDVLACYKKKEKKMQGVRGRSSRDIGG